MPLIKPEEACPLTEYVVHATNFGQIYAEVTR